MKCPKCNKIQSVYNDIMYCNNCGFIMNVNERINSEEDCKHHDREEFNPDEYTVKTKCKECGKILN